MNKKSAALKRELLSNLIKTRTAILRAASGLSPAAQDTVFLGVWSVIDLIAHLVGWDFTNLAAAKDIQAGVLPGFYAHYDKDWKSYNAELVAKYKREDFNELLALARDSHSKLIEYLENLSTEVFDKDFGVRSGGKYKITIARLLGAEWKDEGEHLKQLQEFKANL